MLPATPAKELWKKLLLHGVRPIGLGARDTLRLEAGMNLYGNDMDETVTPFESNMAATVVLEKREFIGSEAPRPIKKKKRWYTTVLEGEVPYNQFF